MFENEIDLTNLGGNQSDKLSGINSWENLYLLGRNNLERIIQVAQENIYRMMAEHADSREMRKVKNGIDLISNKILPHSADKPTLPKLRNEVFRLNDSVCAYLGDTPETLTKREWLRGKVIGVSKSFNKDWKDGKANSGYFWKITVEFDEDIFPHEKTIQFSTTEPRVIFDWEYDYLKTSGDNEFLQIFSDNAFRQWKPLWCIEKNLDCASSQMNMKNWIQNGANAA